MSTEGEVKNMDTAVTSHYEQHSAALYDDAFFYEPGAYQNYLRDKVKERMSIDSASINNGRNSNNTPRILLDVGGGTGNFTNEILLGTGITGVVVDPFLKGSSNNDSSSRQDSDTGRAKLCFVKAPGEVFMDSPTNDNMWWRTNYHQVLMKEVVHHFSAKDRPHIFKGVHTGLASNDDTTASYPSLLVITRPQYEIDYPLWDAARKVWAKGQPPVELFIQELQSDGFTNIQYTIEAYPCSIKISRWLEMVQNRFWSTFSGFSKQELIDGCNEIRNTEAYRIDDEGVIMFEDRLIFISAHR